MAEKENCKCPLCEQAFTPEDGLSPEEHIAKGIIQVYGKLQEKQQIDELLCPRCGRARLKPMVAQNTISRYTDVYICGDCGTDESLRELRNDALAFADWHIVAELLKSIRSRKCRNYIPEKDASNPLCDNTACRESKNCEISALFGDEEEFSK